MGVQVQAAETESASWHVPEVNSAERRQILDAARMPVQMALDKPVRFLVQWLRVQDDWAFLLADMQDLDGRGVSYENTAYQQAAEHGVISDVFVALLKRDDSHWRTLVHRLGPTDVSWPSWPTEYTAPRDIFPTLGWNARGAATDDSQALVQETPARLMLPPADLPTCRQNGLPRWTTD